MVDLALRVSHLSKQYKIGPARSRYPRLSEQISEIFRAPWLRLRQIGAKPAADRIISALDDVSFELNKGSALGFIGRNGAGKTTLLKILSRITEPSSGRAELFGRVASLLEVGSGFHPELTGRENIFVNGAILGMTRREIKSKFDEIVAFADVEKFLDTPVKHYSTGMGVRLAFSVAAHLQSEILLVDEVLAVGDIAFQKKCLDRMAQVTSCGITVILVSHQMSAIRRLCSTCMWLDAGKILMFGDTPHVVCAYEAAWRTSVDPSKTKQSESNEAIAFQGWEIVNPRDAEPWWLNSDGQMSFKMIIDVNREINYGLLRLNLYDHNGQIVWGYRIDDLSFKPGNYDLICKLPGLPIRPGAYQWAVAMWDGLDLIFNGSLMPELLITTAPISQPRDEFVGLLNLKCDMEVICRTQSSSDVTIES